MNNAKNNAITCSIINAITCLLACILKLNAKNVNSTDNDVISIISILSYVYNELVLIIINYKLQKEQT